jgi:hypothetical protein
MKITRPRILFMTALGLVVMAGAGLLWGQATLLQAGVILSADKDCPVSPTTTERPENANTAAFSRMWYRSLDGRIWASAPGLQSYRPEGNKVLWVKPSGSQLEVKGRRLDGQAALLQVHIPGGYADDYQASGVTFPTPGCWEIEAKADGTEWSFVVYIPEKD